MADTNRASVVADEREEFDRLTLIRLGVWGLSAFLSMMLVVVAAQTDVGVKRAAAAVAAITSPPRDPALTIAQVLARTTESERENRRLIETVRLLTQERDRMATRIDSVEREVGDLTGSIKSATSANQAQPAPSDTKGNAPGNPAAALPSPAPMKNVQPSPPPVVAPTASIPAGNATIATPTVTPSVVPPPAVPPQVPPPAPANTSSSSAQPMVVASSMVAPVAPAPIDPKTARAAWPSFMPKPTSPSIEASAVPAESSAATAPEAVPLPRPSPIAQLQAYAAATARGETAIRPPELQANLPADVTNSVSDTPAANKTASAAGPAPAVDPADSVAAGDQPKVEIGVDLGPGLSIAKLRSRWEAFSKAQGANLAGVRPLVSIREISPNKPVELRLVVGPLAGIDVAVQLCQSLSGSQFPCQPAVFDGQRLVLR